MQRNNFSKKPSRWNEFWHMCASKEIKIESKNKTVFVFKPFLALQGVLALAIVISFFSLAGAILFRVHKIDQTALIKATNTVHSPIVAGQKDKVRWTTFINKSRITDKKNLLKLPKDAKNIKVTTVSQKQAKKTSTLVRKNSIAKLTTEQRQQLAKTSKSSNNFFAKLTNSMTAALEDAVTNIAETITQTITEQAPDATIVDLSEQITETPVVETQTEETPAVATQEVSETSTVETEPVEAPVVQEQATSTEVVTSETEQAVEDEVVQIEYETPAPVITEQPTDTGKQVTVSVENELPEQPLTNVLAFSSIPEIYKVGQENKIQIKWHNNGDQNVTFSAYDTDNNGKLDYVEWTVPHLSDQVFEIIFISKAFRLDADQNITEDIYDQTKEKDNNWATINNGEYVRATFGEVLDNTKDNTIYAKATTLGQPATIEVYPVYIDAEGNQTQGPLVAVFQNVDAENTYRVLLTNLQTPTDVFDLKVSGSVDIDFIVDPVQTLYWVGNAGANTSVATNWKTSNPAGCGGGNSLVAPVAGDTIIFDPDCDNGATIDSALSVANFTIQDGYTGTITQNANVTVSGTFSQSGANSFVCSDPTNKTFSAVDFDIDSAISFWRMTGSGTEGAPYLVRDVYDLQSLISDKTKYYKLNNNIDASGTSGWRSGQGFFPIGNQNIGWFSGTLDGDNKTINNMYIAEESSNFAGVFGGTNGGILKNIGIVGGTFIAKANIYVMGPLVGSVSGQGNAVDNCYSTANITCEDNTNEPTIGGLIALNMGGASITNSYATGDVNCEALTSSCVDIGGFIGADVDGVITNSFATGNVTGIWCNTGGFIGRLDGTDVSKCYATGNVSRGYFIGGFAGSIWGSATNCYATGNVSEGISNPEVAAIGGFVGYELGSGAGVSNCYSKGSVTSATASYIGGFIGDYSNSYITYTNVFYDTTTSGQSGSQPSGVTGLATAAMKTATTYSNAGWSGSVWNMENGYYPNFVGRDSSGPTLAETGLVATPGTDTTPNYTFTSTETGTITYGGSCSSATTEATSGSNTITFAELANGTYSDCTITVTDASTNASLPLTVTSFRIGLDSTPPTLSNILPVTNTRLNTDTTTVTLTLSEEGSCRATTDSTHTTYATMSGDVDCTGDGTTSASCQMTDLTNTTNNVYIICQDLASNSSETSQVVYTQPYIGAEGAGVASPSPVQASSTQEEQSSATTSTLVAENQLKPATIIFDLATTLKITDIGLEVLQLQRFLNNNGFPVALTGIGSKGFETNYFGPATKKALMKFQNFFADKVLKPAGLETSLGIFGKFTKMFINSLK